MALPTPGLEEHLTSVHPRGERRAERLAVSAHRVIAASLVLSETGNVIFRHIVLVDLHVTVLIVQVNRCPGLCHKPAGRHFRDACRSLTTERRHFRLGILHGSFRRLQVL